MAVVRVLRCCCCCFGLSGSGGCGGCGQRLLLLLFLLFLLLLLLLEPQRRCAAGEELPVPSQRVPKDVPGRDGRDGRGEALREGDTRRRGVAVLVLVFVSVFVSGRSESSRGGNNRRSDGSSRCGRHERRTLRRRRSSSSSCGGTGGRRKHLPPTASRPPSGVPAFLRGFSFYTDSPGIVKYSDQGCGRSGTYSVVLSSTAPAFRWRDNG